MQCVYICGKIVPMAEDHKPYVIENKTKVLREIMDQVDATLAPGFSITVGEAKRIELIRKMKQDKDKQEYLMMLNGLAIAVVCTGTLHLLFAFTWWPLIIAFITLAYVFFVRRRLTTATQALTQWKNDFDRYLWEGFYLKEMRFSATKLAFILFFPWLVIMLTDVLHGGKSVTPLWVSALIAYAISTLAWYLFFSDDSAGLESIESELKSLEYL